MPSTPESEPSQLRLPECCVRYLRTSLDLLVEWATASHEDGFVGKDSYLEAMSAQLAVGKRILDGQPCPWHDAIPENYLTVMKMIGGSDGRT